MVTRAGYKKEIWVYANWIELGGTLLMGTLKSEQVRGREVFSFTYSREWLEKGLHWY